MVQVREGRLALKNVAAVVLHLGLKDVAETTSGHRLFPADLDTAEGDETIYTLTTSRKSMHALCSKITKILRRSHQRHKQVNELKYQRCKLEGGVKFEGR